MCPVAEWDESVADPVVVVDRFHQRDLLNEPLVGIRDQAIEFGIMRVLEAVSNDPGYEGHGIMFRHNPLKVATYLPRLQRADTGDQGKPERKV